MTESKPSAFGHHHNSIKKQAHTPKTGDFGHHPVAEAEFEGIEMGVLNDGTAFLTLRGLARVCGVDHAPLLRFANNWGEEVSKARGSKVLSLLESQGHPGDLLYVRIIRRGVEANAFPDAVCMALLEYYAFEAGPNVNETAKRNYRLLARKSFRDFIYNHCGYQPSAAVSDEWRQYHDRVSLLGNSVPPGYFGIFHAIADLFVTLGQHGLHANSSFVPDISVGQAWSAHWKKTDGDARYGERIRYPHDYPPSFPQSAAGTKEPWAYPEMALGEFSKWMRENYIGGGRLSRYVNGAVKSKKMPITFAQKAILAIETKAMPGMSARRQ